MRVESGRGPVNKLARLALAVTAVTFIVAGCGPSGGGNLPEHGEPWGEGHTLEHAPGVQGEVRAVTVPGPDGEPFTIWYEVIGDLAVFQGDMILGTAQELAALEGADGIEVQSSVFHSSLCWTFLGITVECRQYRWPAGVVPYVFADDWDDPAFAGDENADMHAGVRAAMDEIERVSSVRFVARTTEADYVRFKNGDGCSSDVGRQGGRQDVELNYGCRDTFTVAHELLHALGFNHEQSRRDRDSYVEILWDNIDPGKRHNFEITSHSYDVGPYDYGSLMHYSGSEFCRRDQWGCTGRTIATIPAGTYIGQRARLSAGDVMALNVVYPGLPPTISVISPADGSTFPRGYPGIYLEATVYDPEGRPLTVTWSSDVSGVLASGTTAVVDSRRFAYGPHVLTAQVVDQQGNFATASVELTISNEPPTVTILRPSAGTFCSGEVVEFQARAVDVNEVGYVLPGVGIAWRVGTAAPFAYGGTVTRAFATPGTYEVFARAIDDAGAVGEASVALTVADCGDAPPTVHVDAPADNTSRVYDGFDDAKGLYYADVDLAGHASDPEDGALSGASLVWRTGQTTLQPALLGTGSGLSVRLYGDQCGGVTHTLSLTATDSYGNARVDSVRLFIYTVC